MAWAHGRRPADDGGGGGSVVRETIYWLNGMAGTGKSTIARTIARTCADQGRLGASFFFSRGGGDLETARWLVTTIAVQLAQQSRQLRAAICRAISAHADIANQTLIDQWKQLVLRPSEQLPLRLETHQQSSGAAAAIPATAADDNDDTLQSPPPWIIVIDALNECTDDQEIAFVLQLLAETCSRETPSRIRVFLTSRPENTIREGFRDSILVSGRRQLFLHRLDPSIADQDIRVFVDQNLGSILRKRPDWTPSPASDIVEALVQRAGGLFIWAATACRFIRDGGPKAGKRLEMVLWHKAPAAGAGPERTLDEIYQQVLKSVLRDSYSAAEKAELCSALRTVLGTLVVLFSALPATSLAALLQLPEHAAPDALCDLHSIFDVPDDLALPIRPQHATVRDFLLDRRRCVDTRFWVDERLAHAHVAHHCFRLLDGGLSRDMCGLQAPGALACEADPAIVAGRFPPHLRYACQYWAQHICRGENKRELDELVLVFMQTHFLHWLEALSLLGKLAAGVEMLGLLESHYVSKKSDLQSRVKCRSIVAELREIIRKRERRA